MGYRYWTACLSLAALLCASPLADSEAASAAFSGAKAPTTGFMAGVIEGFYGPVWSAGETTALFGFMAAHHLNTFVYAPKYDPYQRAEWDRPYPPKRLAYLANLVHAAQRDHLIFVYSISPGQSINYHSAHDFSLLMAKIRQVESLGVRHFMLSFDDITSPPNFQLAVAQAQLADHVLHQERQSQPTFSLLFTPTLYYGTSPNPYWRGLKTALYQGIDVIWTGPWVLSRTITASQARTVEQLTGHRLVIWDNYPVNDYTYVQPPHHPRLFLGPLTGRSAGLVHQVGGYFFNPMLQAEASEIALWTGAAFLHHPHRYRPLTAWSQAVVKLGGGAQKSLRLFAKANSQSYLSGTLSTLNHQVTQFWAHPPAHPLQSGLAATFAQMAATNHDLAEHLTDQRLYQQIAPWSRLFSQEGQAGLNAIRLWTEARSGHRPSAEAVAHIQQSASTIQHTKLSLDTSAPLVEFLNAVASHLHD